MLPSSIERPIETMLPLTPEALAADAVRQGFATDLHQETIAYYQRFMRGKNSEIERLYATRDRLEGEVRHWREQLAALGVAHWLASFARGAG